MQVSADLIDKDDPLGRVKLSPGFEEEIHHVQRQDGHRPVAVAEGLEVENPLRRGDREAPLLVDLDLFVVLELQDHPEAPRDGVELVAAEAWQPVGGAGQGKARVKEAAGPRAWPFVAPFPVARRGGGWHHSTHE